MRSICRRIVLILLPACFGLIGGAQSVGDDLARTNEDPWVANWIGVEDQPKPNQWICYRKNLELDSKPKNATARIACDSKYWLWVNGEQILREGQLKRGPTPNSTYYDQVDLSESLTQGTNTIAILVWYFGKDGFSHKSSGCAALVFDGQVDRHTLASDSTWRAKVNPAFSDTEKPHPNYRLPESNIRFDARQELIDQQGKRWFESEFDDQAWPSATSFGKPPIEPWGKLYARPIPQWKDFGLKNYENHESLKLPRVSDGKVFKAKLPYNAQINPYLKIESAAGKSIDVRMDNYRGGGPPNLRAEYVSRKGEQSYENLGWINGHEAHYLIPAGVKVLELKYRETGFDTDFSGKFECDDEFLNRLRRKSLRTLYVTMRDTYFDCPDRERAQWWGDAVLEMGEAFYALDVRSHCLARKGMQELIGWQRADGSIFSPMPAGNYDSELPMQMLATVGQYGFWTYALHSGDIQTIRRLYPGVKQYLSLWTLDETGLVVPRKGGWTWGDWGKNKDMPLLFNGWYYLALQGQANMATAIGAVDDAQNAIEKMQQIKEAFNRTFWTGEEYRSPDYKGATDDRGHALAVLCGIADEEKFKDIARVFQRQMHSSPYMEKYVLEALYRMQRPTQAIARIKKRYQKMVDSELTTLWEGWGIGKEGFGGGTINHAWSGGPLTIMSQYMAGIQPIEPGYRRYEIRPQMGPLKNLEAKVTSVAGNIEVKINKSPSNFEIRVTSPQGTIGRVCIPVSGIKKVVEQGETLWSDQDVGPGEQRRQAVKMVEQNKRFVVFQIAPGSYHFTAEK